MAATSRDKRGVRTALLVGGAVFVLLWFMQSRFSEQTAEFGRLRIEIGALEKSLKAAVASSEASARAAVASSGASVLAARVRSPGAVDAASPKLAAHTAHTAHAAHAAHPALAGGPDTGTSAGACTACRPSAQLPMSARAASASTHSGVCQPVSGGGAPDDGTHVLAPCQPSAYADTGVSETAPVPCEDNHWVKVDNTFHRECLACTVHHPFATGPYYINTHDPKVDTTISGVIHSRKFFDEGVWTFVQGAIKATTLTKPTGVDVGGNIGWFTMLMLAHGLHVTTFEPLTTNANRIRSSVFRNNWVGRHRLYQNAIGAAVGTLNMAPTHANNPGNGKVIDAQGHSATAVYGTDYVYAARLDSIVDTDVSVMKIDVESFEPYVIDGSKHLFCSRVVENVLFEVAYTGSGCDYQKIHDFFVALGYDLHAVYDPPPYSTPSSVEPWFIPGQVGAPDGGNDAIYTLRNPERGSPCKQHSPSMCDC